MIRQVLTAARIALSISLVFAYIQTSAAQDSLPTPTDEQRRLEEEIRILKLKKEKAMLNNEIREAVLSPTATPLPGDTELTDVTLEPQIMSYRAMSTTCNCIATRIHSRVSNADIIVIYDPAAAAGLKYYRFSYPIVDARLKGAIDRLQKAIDDNKPKPLEEASLGFNKINPMIAAAGALPVAKDVMRSFADILALLRTDTKIEGKTLSIQQKALVAETLYALREKYGDNVVLYDPGSFSPDEAAGRDASGRIKSKVLGSLVSGYEKRDLVLQVMDLKTGKIDALKQAIRDAEGESAKLNDDVAKLEAALKKAKTKKEQDQIKTEINLKKVRAAAEKAKIDTAKGASAKAESELSGLTALIKSFDALVTELLTVNEKTGTNDLLTFLKAESLELVLHDPADQMRPRDYYWLDIASVGAGGNNRTRKNLFRYLAGSKIDHSGGVILEWQLLNPKWQFVDGGKTQVYEGYLTSKKVRDNQAQFSADDSMKKCGYPAPVRSEERNLARRN